eukprot:Em0001g2938a
MTPMSLKDLGNMNYTAHRQDYEESLVCEAVNRGWGLDLSVNKHHDIISGNQLKVSGSSSKLAKDSAFHHFTLLLCANTANMTTLLRPAPLQMLVEVEPGEEGVFPRITKMADELKDLKRSNMAVKLRHGHHESEDTCLGSDTFPYDHHGASPPPADYSILVPCTAITFEPIVAMEIVTLQMQTVLQVSQDLRPSNRAANEDLKPGVQVIRWTFWVVC